MIALDTHVLVRLLTRDDPGQAEAAAEVMRADSLWLAKTVVLELVWVLDYTYGFDRSNVVLALSRLLGLAHLRVEDAAGVALAVRCYEQGMDFADALHLASSGEAAELVTFDRKLSIRAQELRSTTPVRLLETTRPDRPAGEGGRRSA